MMTLSNWNISRVTGHLWGFPYQRSVTQSFDVFFDVRLNKRLSNQSRCRWFGIKSYWSVVRRCVTKKQLLTNEKSTLVEVTAWYCQATIYIYKYIYTQTVLCYEPYSNSTPSAKGTILYNEFEKYTFEITATSPWGQWVNQYQTYIWLMFPGCQLNNKRTTCISSAFAKFYIELPLLQVH